ncbi:MAG: HD domain-containing protein [Candidatus Dormibacteria bacterium]
MEELLGSAAWALETAGSLLSDMGQRWIHVRAVAAKANQLAAAMAPDLADVLVAAAWLHDIGYSPTLLRSGFHPLDGADYLHRLGEHRLAGLVAFHSGARFEAQARGLTQAPVRFRRERSMVADVLDWCDLTTDSNGDTVSLETRVAGVIRRHGLGSPVVDGLQLALPSFRRSLARVERSLLAPSLGWQVQSPQVPVDSRQ